MVAVVLTPAAKLLCALCVAIVPTLDLQDPAPSKRTQDPKPKAERPQSKPTNVDTRPTLLVIVNAKNPMTKISASDLRSYFKKERRFWPDGERTLLCLRRNASVEMQILLAEVYGWNAKQLRRHWKGKSFRGEITGGKAYIVAPTAASAIARVQSDPTAISIVLATDLAKDVKGVRALAIDGKRATDKDYPLRGKAKKQPPVEPGAKQSRASS